MWAQLPDELWRRILEVGIESCGFSYKDLCCISISCRRLHRLSNEHSFWNHLLSSDFPLKANSSLNSAASSSSKSLYKLLFERDKERRLAAHRRAILRKESQIAEHSRKIRQIETRLAQESSKMKETVAELSNLHKVRQASVALNVWQPEVIRGRQKQIVEQSVVPAESRIRALEMELKLCKQQIMGLEKSYKDEKHRLDTAKEELVSMRYHPVQERMSACAGENEYNVRSKKLKRCDSCEGPHTSFSNICSKIKTCKVINIIIDGQIFQQVTEGILSLERCLKNLDNQRSNDMGLRVITRTSDADSAIASVPSGNFIGYRGARPQYRCLITIL